MVVAMVTVVIEPLAVAYIYAIQDNRNAEEAINAGRPLGAALRAQITSHIAKYRHFANVFAVDLRWTAELEGGPVPQYLPHTLNESKALPGLTVGSMSPCLSTAATKLRRNIAIWRWETDQWVKQTVVTPLPAHPQNVEDATKYPPLPSFLKDAHYATLKQGKAPFPMSWHDNPPDSKWDAGSARGGGRSYRSWLRLPRLPVSLTAAGCLRRRLLAHRRNLLLH